MEMGIKIISEGKGCPVLKADNLNTRKCENHDSQQTCRPSWPVTRVALPFEVLTAVVMVSFDLLEYNAMCSVESWLIP
jgi:hypothetical protein